MKGNWKTKAITALLVTTMCASSGMSAVSVFATDGHVSGGGDNYC